MSIIPSKVHAWGCDMGPERHSLRHLVEPHVPAKLCKSTMRPPVPSTRAHVRVVACIAHQRAREPKLERGLHAKPGGWQGGRSQRGMQTVSVVLRFGISGRGRDAWYVCLVRGPNEVFAWNVSAPSNVLHARWQAGMGTRVRECYAYAGHGHCVCACFTA